MNRCSVIAFCPLAISLLVSLAACTAPNGGPYAPQSESTRNPLEAQRLTLKAADILTNCGDDSDRLAKAEALLREALSFDLYHGPAHNNLGVVYLRQGDLYRAASECEWAKKLLPGLPDPRVNLAITLERAGRTRDALENYRTALEVYPEHIEAMQGLARLQFRRSRIDEETPRYLHEIALRGTTAVWRSWAQSRLAHLER